MRIYGRRRNDDKTHISITEMIYCINRKYAKVYYTDIEVNREIYLFIEFFTSSISEFIVTKTLQYL